MLPEIKVVPFRREHLTAVLADGTMELSEIGFYDDPALLAEAENSGNSWTLTVDGMPVACGGTVTMWPGRHAAWAVLARAARYVILAVTRTAREVVQRPRGRVECTVRADFPQGQGWARLLGFEVETPVLKHFGPAGEDHVGFVRFNQWQ